MVSRVGGAALLVLVGVADDGAEGFQEGREGVRGVTVGGGVGGGLVVGGVAALGCRDRVAFVRVEGVVIAVRERRPGALEMPTHVERQQADEQVRAGAISLAVANGAGGLVVAHIGTLT